MKPVSFLLNITSEDPKRMATSYGDIMRLQPNPIIGEAAFDLLPGLTIHIDGHSETRGRAKEPQRMMLDFFVENLAAEQARLKTAGVQFIREAGREEWGGVISTFLDPDGNYCQLIEYSPEKNGGSGG
jgi:predicted enzyme related to lactoylglutathione lyase